MKLQKICHMKAQLSWFYSNTSTDRLLLSLVGQDKPRENQHGPHLLCLLYKYLIYSEPTVKKQFIDFAMLKLQHVYNLLFPVGQVRDYINGSHGKSENMVALSKEWETSRTWSYRRFQNLVQYYIKVQGFNCKPQRVQDRPPNQSIIFSNWKWKAIIFQ